ncbi:MAG: Crp/Fnr family transcriptional regulator [Gammaproteobacteria bacterium]|nr:Crp/Fnr family transcriptional regulator [Gammaproteobacteria bacterium]MDH5515797.1 Crp/Fnr family transcriptional regulator [Gammaproteobacteria bacterium]
MLDNIELFSGLEPDELARLSSKAVIHSYPKNTIVINQGDISNSLHIVVSGSVRVFLGNEDGKEIILNTHGPGESFGEMALLDAGPRSASVITTEASKLAIISRTDFEDFLQEHPQTMMKVLQQAFACLRALTDTVSSLALLDVYGRVARLLLQSAEDEKGVKIVKQAMTQQDIANHIGSSREMVSRILKDLKAGGYIEMQGKQIILRQTLPRAW